MTPSLTEHDGRIARVVPLLRLHHLGDRRFDYLVPETLAGPVTRGSIVTVPFGKRTVRAVVLEWRRRRCRRPRTARSDGLRRGSRPSRRPGRRRPERTHRSGGSSGRAATSARWNPACGWWPRSGPRAARRRAAPPGRTTWAWLPEARPGRAVAAAHRASSGPCWTPSPPVVSPRRRCARPPGWGAACWRPWRRRGSSTRGRRSGRRSRAGAPARLRRAPARTNWRELAPSCGPSRSRRWHDLTAALDEPGSV